MRLGTAIALGVATLIAAILVATIASVAMVVERSARGDVAVRLERSRGVFRALHADRQARFRSESRVIAEEPRLKAAVATEDPHLPTIAGVAASMKETARSQLFLLLDAEGVLVVDAARPDDAPEGVSLADRPVVSRALAEGDAVGVWADDDGAYLIAVQRIGFGAQVVGAVVIGHAVEDGIARAVSEQTGSATAVLLGDRVLAAAGFDPHVDRGALPAALAAVGTDGRRREVAVGGTEYVAVGARFPDYDGSRQLTYVVLENLDVALAPGRRVTRILYAILAAGIVLAVVFAFALSSRLSRPLDQLVRFTRLVASGDLTARAAVGGPLEVRQLEAAMNRMVNELGESRAELAEKHRLENELEIAEQIQTSITPDAFAIEGLDIAAGMEPASEVGGDYYDAIAVDGGGWIAIGDVAGHGLSSGLVMLMAQTSVASLVEAVPEASPRGVLMSVNRVIYDNVHRRMRRNRHMTMSVIRYFSDGRMVVAGAHLDIALLRAATGKVEEVQTVGTWIGMVEEIGAVTTETEIELDLGDVMVLYTDGVTEAESAAGEMFGFDRLSRVIATTAGNGPAAVRDAVFDAVRGWRAAKQDDASVVVMKYVGCDPAVKLARA